MAPSENGGGGGGSNGAQNKSDKRPFDTFTNWIVMNKEYFKTAPGIVKIVQLIFGVLCLYLASPARSTVATQWFLFIVIISFVVTVIWCFVYFLGVRQALNFPINWPLTELLNMALVAVMYLIVSVFHICSWIAAHNVPHRTANLFAGAFGVGNVVFYLMASYLSFLEWKHTNSSDME